jgi:hypothetical protein
LRYVLRHVQWCRTDVCAIDTLQVSGRKKHSTRYREEKNEKKSNVVLWSVIAGVLVLIRLI